MVTDFNTNIWIVCDCPIMVTTEIDWEDEVSSGYVETGSLEGGIK